MKKFKRIFIGVLLSLTLVTGVCLGTATDVNAATITIKTKTANYGCNAHGLGCMYVSLSAKFISQKCTDVYWSGSSMHWPNGVTFGDTKKYTIYARGTYTVYTSIITEWTSLTFYSETNTLYIYN